jgi:hypothetical protein
VCIPGTSGTLGSLQSNHSQINMSDQWPTMRINALLLEIAHGEEPFLLIQSTAKPRSVQCSRDWPCSSDPFSKYKKGSHVESKAQPRNSSQAMPWKVFKTFVAGEACV